RRLLQVPRGEARTVPLRSSAGARELPQLSQSARHQQRIHAQRGAAAAMPAVPYAWSTCAAGQSVVALLNRELVPELPFADSRLEQSVGSKVPEVARQHASG